MLPIAKSYTLLSCSVDNLYPPLGCPVPSPCSVSLRSVMQVHAAANVSGKRRKALVYIESYISTQPSDRITYADSAVTAKDGLQVRRCRH